MNEDSVKINTINLSLGKKKLELTIEEAQKLKKILNELFGKEIVKEVIHEHHYDWRYVPYFWETNKPSFPYEPYVTFSCSNKTNSLDINL